MSWTQLEKGGELDRVDYTEDQSWRFPNTPSVFDNSYWNPANLEYVLPVVPKPNSPGGGGGWTAIMGTETARTPTDGKYTPNEKILIVVAVLGIVYLLSR